MADKKSTSAFLIIDYINEIVDPKGKLAGKGYTDFIERHNTFSQLERLLSWVRSANHPVIHVGLGFSSNYNEQPEGSPLFGTAKKFGALQLGTWATEFHSRVAPLNNERVLTKHRVSAFYGTPLDVILRTYGVEQLYICGVATDVAVQSAARDAHDRDYEVVVLSDCCAAANDEDHEQTLRMLGKIAKVTTVDAVGSLLPVNP